MLSPRARSFEHCKERSIKASRIVGCVVLSSTCAEVGRPVTSSARLAASTAQKRFIAGTRSSTWYALRLSALKPKWPIRPHERASTLSRRDDYGTTEHPQYIAERVGTRERFE